MENYRVTREELVFAALLFIRSIGIESMAPNGPWTPQTPGECHSSGNIAQKLVNVMSYYYTAMSLTIPEAFNTQARPVLSRESTYFQNLDNSNGTALNATFPAQQIAVTLVSNSLSATVDSPPVPTGLDLAAFTNISMVPFPTLTDTAHTNTENCFPFLPSISVQGSPTLECDCMTTTASLTVQGGSTSCALSGTLFPINPWQPDAGVSGVSTVGPALPPPPSSTPLPAPSAPVDPCASEYKDTIHCCTIA